MAVVSIGGEFVMRVRLTKRESKAEKMTAAGHYPHPQ